MEELARSQYLKTMGIKQWVPRKPLPGAKALPQNYYENDVQRLENVEVAQSFTLPSAEELIKKEVRIEAIVAGSSASIISAIDAADNKNTSPEVQRILEKPKASGTEKVDHGFSKPPQFRLEGMLFTGQCLVINDVTSDTSEQQPESNRLLRNILAALGFPPLEDPSARTFNWPLLRNSHIDQSESVAVDATQAFITKQLSGQSIKLVLLMGNNAQKFVTPDFDSKTIASFLQGQEVIAINSLSELLISSDYKREAWTKIQSLRLS